MWCNIKQENCQKISLKTFIFTAETTTTDLAFKTTPERNNKNVIILTDSRVVLLSQKDFKKI